MKDKYWIAFSAIEQLDSTFIQRLYNYFGDIEIAFNAELKDLKEIAADCKDASEMKEQVKNKYGNYGGENYLDMTVGFFFPHE